MEADRQQIANLNTAMHEILYGVARHTGGFAILRLGKIRPKSWVEWRLIRDGIEPWWQGGCLYCPHPDYCAGIGECEMGMDERDKLDECPGCGSLIDENEPCIECELFDG